MIRRSVVIASLAIGATAALLTAGCSAGPDTIAGSATPTTMSDTAPETTTATHSPDPGISTPDMPTATPQEPPTETEPADPPSYDEPIGPATEENLRRVALAIAPALRGGPDFQVGGTTVTFVFDAGALADAAETCAIAAPAVEAAITEPVRVMMNYPDGATLCEPNSATTDEPTSPAGDGEVSDGNEIPADFPYRDAPLPDLPLDGVDRIHGVAEVWSLRYAAPDRTEIDAYIAALRADPRLRPGMTSSTGDTDMTQFLADDYDLIVAVTAQNDGTAIMTANFTAKG